jgi:hypothetical protein
MIKLLKLCSGDEDDVIAASMLALAGHCSTTPNSSHPSKRLSGGRI